MAARKDDVKPLGEVRCHAGGIAYVFKARGRRGTLYSRCECCGCQQGSGQAFQGHLAQYVPVGTLEHLTAQTAPGVGLETETVTEKEPELTEIGTEAVTEPEPELTENEPEQRPAKAGLLLLLAAGVAGVLASI